MLLNSYLCYIVSSKIKMTTKYGATASEWRAAGGFATCWYDSRQRLCSGLYMAPAALNLLCDYHWPGNVRELENTVERAAVLARSGVIDAQDIQLKPVSRSPGNWTDQIPLADGWKTNLAAAEKT